MLGKHAIREIFHAGHELDNAVDKFTVKVVQNNETVWSYTVRVLANFVVIARGGKITANVCAYQWRFLVGLSKLKLNCFKELLESKFR